MWFEFSEKVKIKIGVGYRRGIFVGYSPNGKYGYINIQKGKNKGSVIKRLLDEIEIGW